MMEALEKKLEERDIAFDATDRRIMCFAHIINLCSGSVIRAAGGGEGTPESNLIGLACGVVQVV